MVLLQVEPAMPGLRDHEEDRVVVFDLFTGGPVGVKTHTWIMPCVLPRTLHTQKVFGVLLCFTLGIPSIADAVTYTVAIAF